MQHIHNQEVIIRQLQTPQITTITNTVLSQIKPHLDSVATKLSSTEQVILKMEKSICLLEAKHTKIDAGIQNLQKDVHTLASSIKINVGVGLESQPQQFILPGGVPTQSASEIQITPTQTVGSIDKGKLLTIFPEEHMIRWEQDRLSLSASALDRYNKRLKIYNENFGKKPIEGMTAELYSIAMAFGGFGPYLPTIDDCFKKLTTADFGDADKLPTTISLGKIGRAIVRELKNRTHKIVGVSQSEATMYQGITQAAGGIPKQPTSIAGAIGLPVTDPTYQTIPSWLVTNTIPTGDSSGQPAQSTVIEPALDINDLVKQYQKMVHRT
jgi:hypothetical protein